MKMKKNVIWILCLAVMSLLIIQPAFAQEETAPTGQQLIPRQIKLDNNHDGKVDRIEVYDKKGTILRVEADTTGDGNMNEWVFFKDGIRSRAERDVNGDKKADTFITYDKKGVITKLEADTSGDGKMNEWVYYEGGKPVRAEKDTNADGKPDTWLEY